MIALRDMRDFAGASSVAALGTFDGLHRGHRALILRAVELANAISAVPLVMTFDRHPLSVLNPSAAPMPLISAGRRRELLRDMGVSVLVEHPFSLEFASLSPREFALLVKTCLKPISIVIGYNYSFGSGGRGNAALLSELGIEFGFKVEIIPQVSLNGTAVSSTAIRGLIAAGRIGEAGRMMGAV
jgi:riboflavin kinase/FMN adenylyltransferase